MNKMHKQLLALLAIAGVGNKLTAAYEYDFRNMIGDPIVLKINQSRTDKKDYYQIVYPGKTVKQTFPMGNAYCLAPNGLQWAPYDKTNPFNGGADFIDKVNLRIPEEKQREFGDKIAPHYTFLPIEIVMLPNAVYNELSSSATKLLQGIDALACQTIETVKALKNPIPGAGGGGFGGGTAGGGFGGGGGGATTPKVDKNTQVLELLEQLQATISGVNMKDASAKAKAKNTITTLLSSANVKLLTGTAKINIGNIGAIKNAMQSDASQKTALSIINGAFDAFSGSAPTEAPPAIPTETPTTPPADMPPTLPADIEPSIETALDTSSTKCSFGLGKIGKASGKLAKTTLCTSREFTIYYKTDADDIPIFDKYGRPVLTAETIEGQ